MGFYPQNVIALVWDFDKTLVPGNMQDKLLAAQGVLPADFWLEVNGLVERYRERGVLISKGTAYLNHFISYAQTGRFSGLDNVALRAAGKDLDFYPGVPEIFDRLAAIANDARYSKHDITIEHYIVSTGLRQIIEGSAVGPKAKGIWASEFIDQVVLPGSQESLGIHAPPVIAQIGYLIDDTSKTRALFEINKGVNVDSAIDLNGVMPDADRRVPICNMVCVADGPSDVPMFSVIQQYGGTGFAVYDPTSTRHFEQVALLQEQGRVLATFPADYRPGTAASWWLERAIKKVANRIVSDRERTLLQLAGPGPSHVVEEPTRMPERANDREESVRTAG